MKRRTMTRRQWLELTAGTALAIGLYRGASGQEPQGGESRSVIDVHIHTNFQDAVLKRQARRLSGVDFSPQGLLAEMAENNVRRAITIGFDTQQGELSREAPNPMGLQNFAQHAAALKNIGFIGGVNPYRLDQDNLKRIAQAAQDSSLLGLKIYLGYYHLHPDDDKYKPVYELAARHRLPVMFHTGDTYSANAKVRYAHPLRIDDVAVDFREVTFVLAHLGNPWTIDAAELMYKNPNVYGDLSGFLVGDAAYFSEPKNAAGIEHVVERIRKAVAWVENPKKFLYGSDWPLVPMEPYLDLMRRAIDPEHHELVLYQNALTVFPAAGER